MPVRLIFKNLNILRSILNSISTSFEIKEIIESAGTNLPNLFDFSSFGVLWKEGLLLYLYQDESCPNSFTQEVSNNMIKVFSILGEEPIEMDSLTVQVEKSNFRPKQMVMDTKSTLKSH